MNMKKLGLSLVTIATLSSIAYAGTTSATDNTNNCGRPLIGGAHNFKISTEYLDRQDFNETLKGLNLTLSLTNPTTVSDATLEVTLPSIMSTATLTGKFVVDMADRGTAILSHSNTIGSTMVFDSTSSSDLVSTHSYCFVDAPAANATCLDIPFTIPENTSTAGSAKISWKVFSNSGTAVERDTGDIEVKWDVAPQFKINCVSKLDGLVNWENGRKSFVVNKHGVDAGNATDVQTTTDDRLIFNVTNTGGWTKSNNTGTCNTNFDAWLDGNGTNFDVISSEPISNANIALALTSTTPTVVATVGTILPDGKTARFTTDAATSIVSGITEYIADFNHAAGYANNAVIPATTFSGAVDLQANGVDRVEPANALSAKDKANLGEWRNHAYIAQVAGATQTTATQTKLFIVNRSCAPVTPKFRLIKDGVVTEVTGTEIPVDSQQKTTLGSLLSSASLPDGQYAVEIILAGVAEDFYIYAQAQGVTDKTITKDLPVKTTSTRN